MRGPRKAPPKLVCLEAYWNEKLFQTFSVKGFFEAMAPNAVPLMRASEIRTMSFTPARASFAGIGR